MRISPPPTLPAIQVTARGVAHSAALEAAVHENVARLLRVQPRVFSCHVVVERVARHKRHGNQITVRLDIRHPGGEFAVNRDHADDMYVALRDAFRSARRRLPHRGPQKRGDVKSAL